MSRRCRRAAGNACAGRPCSIGRQDRGKRWRNTLRAANPDIHECALRASRSTVLAHTEERRPCRRALVQHQPRLTSENFEEDSSRMWFDEADDLPPQPATTMSTSKPDFAGTTRLCFCLEHVIYSGTNTKRTNTDIICEYYAHSGATSNQGTNGNPGETCRGSRWSAGRPCLWSGSRRAHQHEASGIPGLDRVLRVTMSIEIKLTTTPARPSNSCHPRGAGGARRRPTRVRGIARAHRDARGCGG
jgi:hypothetical protein